MTQEKLIKFFDTLQAELSTKLVRDEAMSFAAERLGERARKRARIHKSDLREQAVQGFIATNELVRNQQITLDPQVEAAAKDFISVVLERYTSSMMEDAIQTALDLRLIFDSWKFGPGASNGIQGTHTAEKIMQPMTCNTQSETLVRKLRSTNPYLCRFDSDNGITGVNSIRGSRLATVPKNEDTERTIAIEPSGQMCLQLAGGIYLEGALRYAGLDIRKQQPKNKAAALRGSIDGSLATIDMKSASDMISLGLVRRLLPREWIWFLETVRSREIMLPNGEWLTMHMISTMGNGFTFPLMTLLICSLIYGYRLKHGGPFRFIDWSDTCVYGDDVIIPTHEYQGVCDTLTSAGFVINTDKSFSEGPFRESCGGDYYLGRDVTPFYIKDLRTVPQIYSAINAVLAWCEKTNIFLHETLLYLKRCLGGKVFLIPEWHNPDQGILTSLCSPKYSYLSVAPVRVKLSDDNPFTMMLAIGGYILESDLHHFYTPRMSNPRYVVRKSRLPKGFLDGWEPRKRSRRSSEDVGLLVRLIFS